MIKNKENIIALFDLDGVVLDTESQYSVFWDKIGLDYLNCADFGRKIKGQTLVNIYQNYFSEITNTSDITSLMTKFEAEMDMPYIKGAKEFILQLKKANIKTAVVTSSNSIKMNSAYKKHPELLTLFDKILTAEQFERGKPFPDCYLLGAKVFNADINDCFVFEDSFHGITAGKNAGMKVIGLATTNPMESIKDKVDYAMFDFENFTIDKLLTI